MISHISYRDTERTLTIDRRQVRIRHTPADTILVIDPESNFQVALYDIITRGWIRVGGIVIGVKVEKHKDHTVTRLESGADVDAAYEAHNATIVAVKKAQRWLNGVMYDMQMGHDLTKGVLVKLQKVLKEAHHEE